MTVHINIFDKNQRPKKFCCVNSFSIKSVINYFGSFYFHLPFSLIKGLRSRFVRGLLKNLFTVLCMQFHRCSLSNIKYLHSIQCLFCIKLTKSTIYAMWVSSFVFCRFFLMGFFIKSWQIHCHTRSTSTLISLIGFAFTNLYTVFLILHTFQCC